MNYVCILNKIECGVNVIIKLIFEAASARYRSCKINVLPHLNAKADARYSVRCAHAINDDDVVISDACAYI
jgi:hypothetical protein